MKANQISNFKLFRKIWGNLNKKRKKEIFIAFLLMISAGLGEMFSLAAVIPFLSVLTDPQRILEIDFVNKFLNILNISGTHQIIISVTSLFIISVLISSFIRLLNIYYGYSLAAKIGSDLGYEAYRRTLYQPYKIHIYRNSSSVITSIISNTERTVDVLNFSLQLATSLVVTLGLLATLIIIDWKVASTAGIVFTFSYVLLSKTIKKRLNLNSRIVGEARKKQQLALQEGLGAIRDVILDHSQNFYLNVFRKADIPLWNRQAQSQFLATFPRYSFEALGLVLISILALILFINNGGSKIIPTLGVLALGAQRLLPAMQTIYTGWARIKFQSSMVEDLLDMIEQKIDEKIISQKTFPIKIEDKIRIKDLYFRHEGNQEEILRGINFEIKRGERVGIIGSTGCGKSTLVDILMGLLEPSSGIIEIDGRDLNDLSTPSKLINWKKSIAHVPQNIYLADTSITKNIAFGIPKNKIDFNLVKKVAEDAQLTNFINDTKYGFETRVGERGIQLSGGQKQRIGIARALYKKTKILVLDEATSALDIKTEASVMKSIENLDNEITMIIITHRLSTVEKCDKVVKIEKGKISITYN